MQNLQILSWWEISLLPKKYGSGSQKGWRLCSVLCRWVQNIAIFIISEYHTRAIITRSWFETALNYKPRIFDPKMDEFPCLAHKFSVTLTAVKNGLENIQTAGYNGARTVSIYSRTSEEMQHSICSFYLGIHGDSWPQYKKIWWKCCIIRAVGRSENPGVPVVLRWA